MKVPAAGSAAGRQDSPSTSGQSPASSQRPQVSAPQTTEASSLSTLGARVRAAQVPATQAAGSADQTAKVSSAQTSGSQSQAGQAAGSGGRAQQGSDAQQAAGRSAGGSGRAAQASTAQSQDGQMASAGQATPAASGLDAGRTTPAPAVQPHPAAGWVQQGSAAQAAQSAQAAHAAQAQSAQAYGSAAQPASAAPAGGQPAADPSHSGWQRPGTDLPTTQLAGPGGYAGWTTGAADQNGSGAADSAAADPNAMARTTQLPLFPGGPAAPTTYPPQPGPEPAKRRGRAGLLAAAVALALVSGGAGGGVVYLATQHDSNTSTSSNALNSPTGKTGPQPNAPAGTVMAVAQKVLPSVVMIQVQGQRGAEAGSGVILSPDGLILTNNHVASGMGANAKIQVQFKDGTTTSATVVGIDPVSDLAVMRADNKSGLTPIDLGTSQNLQVGQGVVAVGAPLGLAGTVTTGIVSALNRPVSTSNDAANSQGTVISAVQTDAPINPGNSGGALVDMDGKLIGINTAIATMGAGDTSGQQSGSIGLGFAIPVDQARRVADQLIKTGHATYAQIGISVRQTDDVNGARVLDVIQDGPAAKAGIPAGSIVTRIDDFVVDSGNGLIAAVRSHQPGDKVTVTYTDDKGQNPTKVDVVLAEAAADGTR